jgi:hypothetical protein
MKTYKNNINIEKVNIMLLKATGRWFSPDTPISSTIKKTYRHDITETLLKVALNTIASHMSIIIND